ncbi:zf-HC2 domain-containing protein [Streptomyces sp. NBC_00572]|uniref:zf-HC2 domain-containing protein n=1 Tax=Streptomyces sp. NBC_00572 TaxID=2903664 RepID=UPI00225BF05F|nr:zf-HC2 domain-containing protein [Streptomyces sp. NBC_00572]MCX4983432.1 zf-HC2 domain-containing protein [Streptomyces sp. NBC_00572]
MTATRRPGAPDAPGAAETPGTAGSPWHVSDALALRYAEGSAAETDAWSLEKHVESCADCAGRVSAAVRAGAAGPVLAAVRAELLTSLGHRPAPAESAGPVSPVGSPLGRWARVWWAVGPALRGSWVVAVALVVGGAFGLAYGGGFQGARSLLLALAPVLPLAGVAVSYGRHADPLYEITAATPSGGLRLLLTRTAAVLAVCVPLLTAGGALLPPVAGFPGAAAWLLPGLALTLATLALGSFVGCRAAAATLGGGWLLAVTGPLLGQPGAGPASGAAALAPYFSGPTAQGGWAAAALACAALLALRRRSFDHLEPR